jgi:hypothetical protein
MATPANVITGTGRRKTSTARVRITEGTGKLVCNGRTFESYFSHENFAKQAYAPLLTVDLREKIDVTANVAGGGVGFGAGGLRGASGSQGPRGIFSFFFGLFGMAMVLPSRDYARMPRVFHDLASSSDDRPSAWSIAAPSASPRKPRRAR